MKQFGWVFLIATVISAPNLGYAQVQTSNMGSATGSDSRADLPVLRVSECNQNLGPVYDWRTYGEHPLIPYKSGALTLFEIQNVIRGAKGYEEKTQIVKKAFFMINQTNDERAWAEFQDHAMNGRFEMYRVERGCVFSGRMAFGMEVGGEVIPRITSSPAKNNLDRDLIGYMFEGVKLSGGPNDGLVSRIFIPEECFNMVPWMLNFQTQTTETPLTDTSRRIAEDEPLSPGPHRMIDEGGGNPWYKKKAVLLSLIGAGVIVGIVAARGGDSNKQEERVYCTDRKGAICDPDPRPLGGAAPSGTSTGFSVAFATVSFGR